MRNLSRTLVAVIAAAICAMTFQVRWAIAQDDQSVQDQQVTVAVGQGFRKKLQPIKLPSQTYARYYAPYAIQARAAYFALGPLDAIAASRAAGIEPAVDDPSDPQHEIRADINYAVTTDDYADQTANARQLVKSWQYQFGHLGSDCVTPPAGEPADPNCRSGGFSLFDANVVQFQVWANMRAPRNPASSSCSQVSLAFRGTQTLGDFFSDANQFLGSFNDDAYSWLGRNINTILRRIQALHCYNARTQIVSVGHSLGGGLAQYAALVHSRNLPRIAKVFAFNPSPVTATNTSDWSVVRGNAEGLTIDRVHQDGELLSGGVFRANQQYPPASSACNPFVRTVGFDPPPSLRGASSVQRHYMAPFAQNLVRLSYDARTNKPVKYAVPPGAAGSECHPNYIEPAPPSEEERRDLISLNGGRRFYDVAASGSAVFNSPDGVPYPFQAEQRGVMPKAARTRVHRFVANPAAHPHSKNRIAAGA